MQKSKKLLSVLLALVMAVTMIPAISVTLTAQAEDISTWDGSYDNSSEYYEIGDEILISDANAFAFFADRVKNGETFAGKTVKLTTDVDMADLPFPGVGDGQPFQGTFDGQGHTVSHMRISRSVPAGCFCVVSGGGSIKNLTVADSSTGFADTGSFGFIVGRTQGSAVVSITNCNVENCTVTAGANNIGGVVGKCDAPMTISDCTVTGLTISGVSGKYVGGIAGYIDLPVNATVSNCTVSGSITTSNSCVGGIVGGHTVPDGTTPSRRGTLTIINCENNATLRGTQAVAGILAYTGATISFYECTNNGYVTATAANSDNSKGSAAGILASSSDACPAKTFDNCINTAKIEGKNNTAGICAEVEGDGVANFTYCYNLADISSNDEGKAAGICAYSHTGGNEKFYYCINYGNVSAGTNAAGIVNNGTTAVDIYRCGNFGKITASQVGHYAMGGITDSNTSTTRQCFNVGEVTRNRTDNTQGNLGGIEGGSDSTRTGKVSDSYNRGYIHTGKFVGGVFGMGGTVVNSYNVGTVSNAGYNGYQVIAAASGTTPNNYGLASLGGTVYGYTAKTAAQLRAGDMPEILNASVFCVDTWGVNDGYPIHQWWRDEYFRFPIELRDGMETVKPLQNYAYAETFLLPAREKTGYTFNGWYSAPVGGEKIADGDTTFRVGKTAPTDTIALKTTESTIKPYVEAETLTLYAQYIPHSTTITLNGNGATTPGTSTVTVSFDEDMPAYAVAPQQTGYTFLGYFDDAVGGVQYYNADGSSARTWDKDVATATLYAHWEPNGDTPYTVEHYYMNTTGGWNDYPDRTDRTHTGVTGETVEHAALADPPSFFSYNAGKSGVSSVIADNGGTVVRLYYNRDKISVTFKNAGQVIDSQLVYYEAAAVPPTMQAYTLKDLSQHYRFAGWDTEAWQRVVSTTLTVNARYIPEEHNWGEKHWTRLGSCTDGGEYTVACDSCGQNKTVSVTSVGHDLRYEDNGNGKHTIYCIRGDYHVVENHIFEDGVCTVCGAIQGAGVNVYFKNWQGDVIQTLLNVPFGSTPAYSGGNAALKREPTASTIYEFDKWVQEDDSSLLLGPVTADTVYVPVYTETVRTYPVVFLNWDGSLLATEEVAYGASAEALAPPAIRTDGNYVYTFKGWSADLSRITQKTYAVAQFEARDAAVNWTVTFTDGAGATLYTASVADSEAAVYPMGDPEKAGYTFYGWDKDFSCVTGNLTVNALFLPENGEMVGVTFVNYDNYFLKADVIAKGAAAVYDLAPPARPDDAEHTYTFTGWDHPLENVQENTVFTAQFEAHAVLAGDHTHTYTLVPVQPAKCGVVGVKAHYVCDCGKVFDLDYRETDLIALAIPAREHNWSEPVYTWSADKATCTAERHCLYDDCDAVETETVETTFTDTVPATETTPGERSYTAVFTNPAFTSQSETAVVPQIDPVWTEPTYTWNDDHTAVTATHTDRTDETRTETETVTVSVVTVEPKCGVEGKTVYTAVFTNEAFGTYTETVILPALAHLWSEPAYTWGEQDATCTAQRACQREGCGAVEAETVRTSAAIVRPAACGVAGEKTLRAVFSNAAFAPQSKTALIPALSHDFSIAQSDENEHWYACANNCGEITGRAAHDYTEKGGTVTAAKCGVNATAVYTCACGRTAVKEVPGTALNHDFSVLRTDETYHWYACANNCGEIAGKAAHEYTEMVALVKAAKCGVNATAEFACVCGKTMVKELPDTALSHEWSAPTYRWGAEYAVCTAERHCTRIGCTGRETETVAAVRNVTAEPTCTAAGSAIFTAAFENAAFETQTTAGALAALGHSWGEWVTVTPATASEPGIAKRVCARCGEEETKTLAVAGDLVCKYVKFNNLNRMHYLIDDEGGQTYSVYNSSTVEWISNRPMRFKVVRYANFAYDDVILYANGVELPRDADGWYTLPLTPESVTITAVGVFHNNTNTSTGKVSIWDLILNFLMRIVSFFKGGKK